MEYVHAAAILHELDQEINEENMVGVLEAAGADVSRSRVKALIAALEDVDLDEAVAGASPALAEQAKETATAVEGELEGGEETTDLPDTAEDAGTEGGDGDDDGGGLGDIFGNDS
jgi:large subunit ribosomal protein L12